MKEIEGRNCPLCNKRQIRTIDRSQEPPEVYQDWIHVSGSAARACEKLERAMRRAAIQ